MMALKSSKKGNTEPMSRRTSPTRVLPWQCRGLGLCYRLKLSRKFSEAFGDALGYFFIF
jgi:hypothetical protein